MKKIILVILVLFCLTLITNVKSYAATSPTPTDSPTASDKFNPKILDELKDQVASTVAKLNLVEKRGIIGTVTDSTDTQITLDDINGNTRFVDVDELTKFDGGANSSGSFGISDIKKGQTIGALGLYNKQSRRILARSVEVMSNPKYVHGFVATIDSDNYILNIATDKSEQLQIEFETATKSFSYDNASSQLVKSGFSKVKEGEAIFVVGFPDKIVKNKIDADRIIVLPSVIKGPSVEISPSIVPSTGSGKKLTPIVK